MNLAGVHLHFWLVLELSSCAPADQHLALAFLLYEVELCQSLTAAVLYTAAAINCELAGLLDHLLTALYCKLLVALAC